jgi:hypothetical protein
MFSDVTYCPSTGILARKGRVVGSRDNKGYLRVMIGGRRYKNHRLAWFLTYGVWPTQVDHINQIKDDNRIENLREATTSKNCLNQTGPRSNNKLGIQGVHTLPSGRFRAVLRSKGLGTFQTSKLAEEAYKEAKCKLISSM